MGRPWSGTREGAGNGRAPPRQRTGIGKLGAFSHRSSLRGTRPSLCAPPASRAGGATGRLAPLGLCRGKQDLEQASPRVRKLPEGTGVLLGGEMNPSSRCEGGEPESVCERRAPPSLAACRGGVPPGKPPRKARHQALLSPGDSRLGRMGARVRATSPKEAAGRPKGTPNKADQDAVSKPALGRQVVKISRPLQQTFSLHLAGGQEPRGGKGEEPARSPF